MTRSLKIYQGEDGVPVIDVTEPDSNVHVIWEEVEAGGRAYRGESNLGTFPMRDERGETGSGSNLPSGLTQTSLSAGSRIEWLVNSTRLFRGRIGPKDYTRGRQKADRAREVVVSANDTNFDLRNIIVDGWDRPQETDVARVQALITDYLSGSPRASTVISDTYVAASSNTVTLGAKVYDATDPADILSEVATIADKLHFVTIDDELFYDGYDSAAYPAGLRISDRLSEINYGEGVSSSVSIVDSEIQWNVSGDGFTGPITVLSDESLLFFTQDLDGATHGVTAVEYRSDRTDPATSQSFDLLASIYAGDDLYQAWFLEAPEPSDAAGAAILTSHPTSGFKHNNEYIRLSRTAPPDATTSSGSGTSVSTAYSADAGALCIDWMGYSGTYSSASVPSATLLEETGKTHAGADWDSGSSYQTGGSSFGWTLNGTPGASGWGHIILAFTGEVPTFPPIWDVGPASTEDGMELLSGLRLYYGQGSNTYVYVADPTTANSYWHSEQSLYTNDSLIDTAAKATTLAQSILQHRKFERRTYNVSVGPLNEEQAALLKPGQLIDIKARAIPDADDNFVARRISQLRWTTPVPGTYFAHMMLNRPIKDQPSGIGPKQATDSINRHVEQGSNSHPEYVLRGTLTTQGDLPYRGASDWTRLGIGASNTQLVSTGQVPIWAPKESGSGGMTNPMTTAGDIIKGGASGTPERLAIGASNTHLTSTGVTPIWMPVPPSLTNPMTNTGDIIRGGASGSPTRLAIGGSNTHLTSDGSVPVWMPNSSTSGGSLTHSYIGNNSMGGSARNANNDIYVVKVTLANAGILLSIDAYCRGNGTNIRGPMVGVYSHDAVNDKAELVIAAAEAGSSTTVGLFLTTTDRWLSVPIGKYLPAGTYWLAWRIQGGGTVLNHLYDTSGTAYSIGTSGSWLLDTTIGSASWNSHASTTWSIRGSFLEL